MIEKLLKELGYPDSCFIMMKIDKKQFYDNAELTTQDKNIFTQDIKKITWLLTIKKDTININPYKDEEREYEEIAIIQVELKTDTKIKKITELIQKSIPYPSILIFVKESNILINTALKRNNKVDESKNIIENYNTTDWINIDNPTTIQEQFLKSIHLKQLSFDNLYSFYQDIDDRIHLLKASHYQNYYKVVRHDTVQEINKIIDSIGQLDNKIEELRRKIQKEKAFNQKVEFSMQIKKIEQQKNQFIIKLKED